MGVDFDEEAIAFAKESMASPETLFICGDFLGKVYGEFDAVVANDVIEHILPENEDKEPERMSTSRRSSLKQLTLAGLGLAVPMASSNAPAFADALADREKERKFVQESYEDFEKTIIIGLLLRMCLFMTLPWVQFQYSYWK